jgi:signal transduction histidine kinase
MPDHEPPPAPLIDVSARPPWAEAAKLAGAYLVISAAYVLASSWYAQRLAGSAAQLARFEMIKGVAFIMLTASALGVFNYVQLVRFRRRDADLRRMDRALHQAERSVLAGTFATTVAHDINNGLTSAAMALEELHEAVRDDPALAPLTNEARAAVARITDWNRRFFDLGGDKLLGEVKPFDLAQSLKGIGAMAGRHRSLRAVNLTLALPAAAPFRGSEPMLQRAVLNLLLNAAEAAGAGAEVSLALDHVEFGRYRIAVDDSGPGVPVAMRKKILEPFYTSKESGTGLGLASVLACANLHRGAVAIEDSALGGARFTLTLA